MPRIAIKRLEKRYGDVPVISGLDLVMEDKEFTVLVGPSGCGKSTTLRMIAGLEDVSGGEIWIGDREVSSLEPKDRGIAMVFQDYALYPHMNVAQNMSFALRLARMPRAEIEARVRRVADMLSISHLLSRRPRELSGGQRQRVAMGRALVRDAPVFLFDEPLSNLDAKLRTQMRAELALMRQRVEKNMIYVTHDQVEAMTLADRIVVMNGGVVQQQGSPQELYEKPANLFVAGFIGAPAMNLLSARLVSSSGGPAASVGDLVLPLPKRLQDRMSPDSNIVVGLRPSAIKPAGVGRGELPVNVLLSEYAGAHSLLIGDCAGQRVTVEVASEDVRRGAGSALFSFDPEQLHVFEARTGDAF
jgi:multiple sugar transport system ATP-binding protein